MKKSTKPGKHRFSCHDADLHAILTSQHKVSRLHPLDEGEAIPVRKKRRYVAAALSLIMVWDFSTSLQARAETQLQPVVETMHGGYSEQQSEDQKRQQNELGHYKLSRAVRERNAGVRKVVVSPT